MASPNHFKKSLLASSVAAAVAGVSSPATFAQEGALEEVVVTGIRGSLERSMDIKRDASGVVDAISAEDIGKFPDTNLAESLQRITGVSIDRTRSGEGQEITVRGFGGTNNLILLNNRHMPGSQNPDGGSGSRAFDFSNIASEAVAGVEVYKTSKAAIATGGLGATVNIKTLRPLERPGLHLTASAAMLNDSTNRSGDDATPEVSALFSWTDDSETFGVALTTAIQDRHSGTGGGFVTQLNTTEWNPAVYAAAAGNIINEPDVGELYTRASDVRYFTEDIERERTNTMLTVQFAPTDSLTGTLDYVFAEQTTRNLRKEATLWFVDDTVTSLVFEDGPVKTPVVRIEEYPGGGADLSFAQQLRDSTNELDSVGVNLEFQADDDLSFALDFHNSTSVSEPSTFRGQRANVSTADFGVTLQGVDWTTELPTMIFVADNLGPDTMTTTRGEADWIDNETEISQLQLTGAWEVENGRMDFGIETRDVENQMRFARIQPVFGDWGGMPVEMVPDNFWTPTNHILSAIDDFGVGEFANGAGIDWDFDTVVNWIEGLYDDAQNNALVFPTELEARWVSEGLTDDEITSGLTPADLLPTRRQQVYDSIRDFPDGRFQPDRIWHQNRTIKEETKSFFVQWSMSGDFGGMEANLVTGFRYESTDVTSTDFVPVPVAINWEDDNDFTIGLASETIALTRTGDYDHTLPSIDFDLAIREDLKFRFSTSKSIGRAEYDDLSAGISGFDRDEQEANATRGNPDLLPLESDNLDLSLEWYYADASYVSVGYFEKRTNNFIGERTVGLSPYDVRDPFIGPRRDAAETAVGGIGAGLDAIHSQIGAADPDLNPGDTVVGDAAKGDPIAVWNTTEPTNEKSAKFDGIELAVQHIFGDTGFGLIANYTIVDSDTAFDNAVAGVDQFALTGLSDTFNVVGFYDKDGLQVRLAYNWRDEFLDNTSATGQNDPGYTEEFETFDLSVSYAVTEDLEVFFQGINLTEENERRRGRTVDQLIDSRQFGARYLLGARYTFF